MVDPRELRLGAFLVTVLAFATLGHVGAQRWKHRPSAANVWTASNHRPAPNLGATGDAAHALLAGRPVDLNRASASDLELLPGVGPSLARRIVEYRARQGRFGAVADLDRVRGVGPQTIARLAPMLAVSRD